MKNITLLLTLMLMLGISACQKKSEPTANQKLVLSEQGESKKPVIKIGVILPLTGNGAQLGEKLRDGVQMAKTKLLNTKFRYEFIFEDDQFDGKITAMAAQKLINVDKVDVILSCSSGSGNVINPMAEQNKIVHFGIATDPNVAKGRFNFIHATPPLEEGKGLAKILLEKKLKRVAVLLWNQQGYLAMYDAFVQSIKGTPIEIVSFSKINTGERDFRAMLQKAEQANPDVYFFQLFPPELEIAAKQSRDLGIHKPMTSVEAFAYANEPSLFEGTWFIQNADMSDEMIDAFCKMYRHPNAALVGNIIDMVNLVVHAYETTASAQKPSSDEIVDALLNVKDYDGMLGKLSIDPEGIVQSKATLQEIRNGKPLVIQRDL